MQTLYNEDFSYKPNFDLMENQFNALKQNDPEIRENFKIGIQLLKNGLDELKKNNVREAFEKLSKIPILIWNKGINDLEAASLYYLGCIGLFAEQEESGINSMHSALYKTKDPLLALSIYNHVSIFYLTKNAPDKVIPCCEKSFEIMRENSGSLNYRYHDATTNYNIAEAYYRKQEYRIGKSYVEKAIGGFNELGLKTEAAKSRLLLGIFLVHFNEFSEALKYLEDASKILGKKGKQEDLALLLQYQGLAEIGMNNNKRGVESLKKALRDIHQVRKSRFYESYNVPHCIIRVEINDYPVS